MFTSGSRIGLWSFNISLLPLLMTLVVAFHTVLAAFGCVLHVTQTMQFLYFFLRRNGTHRDILKKII